MGYTKLIVGGFKSIKERTEIPIAPLTLMFGPNSAGKTAVAQAMELLSKRLDKAPDQDASLMRNVLALANADPHAHRLVGDDDLDEPEVTPVVLGVEFDEFPAEETQFEVDVDAARSVALELFWALRESPLQLETVEVFGGTQFATSLSVQGHTLLVIADQFRLNAVRGEQVPPNLAKLIGAGFDAGPSWAASSWNGCLVCIDHPLFLIGDMHQSLLRVAEAATTAKSDFVRFAAVVSNETERVLELRVPATPFHLNGWGGHSNNTETLGDLLRRTEGSSQEGSSEALEEVRSLVPDVDFICSVLSFLLQQVCVNVRRELQVVRVTGARTLLTPDDVAVEVEQNFTRSLSTPLRRYATWLGVSGIEVDMAGYQLSELMKRTDDLVNDALAGELFPSRRYRVKPEVSRVRVEQLVGRYSTEQTSESLKISLYLEDANGRALDFQDVGSGISYVLPVLAALWDSDRSWIEQPELHLHPAAQCTLGDVLIRALNRGRFSIIETHSEHLLLRVLRRIRQTHSGKVTDPELRCSPEAVSVLYFDPQEDGGTRVYPLRISRGGDFMDRWPSGFFEEREQEFFDE